MNIITMTTTMNAAVDMITKNMNIITMTTTMNAVADMIIMIITIITVITMLCVNALGGGEERVGFSRFTLIIAVLFVIFIAFTCINIKEKSTVDVGAPSIGQMFKALIQNDQAMAVVITIVLINCAVYTTSTLVISCFKYDFG